MSKKGTGMRALVIDVLANSEVPLRSSVIAERVHTTSRIVVNAMSSMRLAKVPGFCQQEINGVMHYAVGEYKFPSLSKLAPTCMILPVDIARG